MAECLSAGCVMCSPGCQRIKAHWDSRAKQTAERGCIPIAAVSSQKGLGVTVTSGNSGLNFPELDHILSATKQLLMVFRFDHQADETLGLDSYMEVPCWKLSCMEATPCHVSTTAPMP